MNKSDLSLFTSYQDGFLEGISPRSLCDGMRVDYALTRSHYEGLGDSCLARVVER